MTFGPADVTYVHLVSWPSVWIPPSNTHKVLLLGWTQEALETMAKLLGDQYPTISWALYYVPDFDMQNLEHLDWLLVNHHLTNVIANAENQQALFTALLLRKTTTICVGTSEWIDRICTVTDWHNLSLAQAFAYIDVSCSPRGFLL